MKDYSFLLKNKKVLIIDLDNTILDYDHSHETALSAVLEAFKFSMKEYEDAKNEVKEIVHGVNQHQKVLYFKKMVEKKPISYEFVPKMISMYETEFLKNIRADNSMIELLFSATKKNVKKVLLTNFNVLDQIKKLDELLITNLFHHIISSQDLDVEKPNPFMFYEALRRTNCLPSEAIMIGDSKADIASKIGIDSYPYNCSSFSFGISGKSGSGKTTLAYLIKEVFDSTLIISGDSYHKWERSSDMWKTTTHYNPLANDLDKQDSDVKKLFYNEDILIREYNHVTGLFSNEYPLRKKKTLVVEGLHTFVNEDKYFTTTIFVNNLISDELKIKRDTSYRGKKKEEVQASIDSRKADYLKHIEPQIFKADIVLEIDKDTITFKFRANKFIYESLVHYLKKEPEDVDPIFINFCYMYDSMSTYREVIINFLSNLKRGMTYVHKY